MQTEAFAAMLEKRYGAALYKKISGSTVAVCGLGGLGSHIAMSLARSGIGHLVLIDFDRVDLSNLGRQQYKAAQIGKYKTEALAENIQEITPCTKLSLHTLRLTKQNTPALLNGANIVCEAFDRPEAKAMLTNAVLGSMPETFLVAASGMAGLGSGNEIKTQRPLDRFYLCGDGESDVEDGIGLVCPRVMLCAAHQAQTVLRILAEEYAI